MIAFRCLHLVSGPIDPPKDVYHAIRVCVTLEERWMLLDTRRKAVLAPQLPTILTIKERNKNEGQAYHDRENLRWDRHVRVEVS